MLILNRLIAVMLGPLQMDLNSCINCYLSMAPAVFPLENRVSSSAIMKLCGLLRGKERFKPKPLEDFIQRLIEDRLNNDQRNGKSGNELMLQFEATADLKSPECKMLVLTSVTRCNRRQMLITGNSFVCVTSKDQSHQFIFRNYAMPGSPNDCKIWEACRATSAAPTIFPPMVIGPTKIAYVDGGIGRNNPIVELEREAKELWKHKRDIGCIVSLGTGKMPRPNVGKGLRSLVSALQSIATDTESAAKSFEANVIQTFGSKQEVYFRFNVDQGLEGIGLEEWTQFSTIQVATQAYVETPHVKSKIELCAERLLNPVGTWHLY